MARQRIFLLKKIGKKRAEELRALGLYVESVDRRTGEAVLVHADDFPWNE